MRNDPSLKKRYSNIMSSFQEHQGRARAAIEKWRMQDKMSHYEKYHDMMSQAERLQEELSPLADIDQEAEAIANTHAKVDHLERLHEALKQEIE